MLISENQLSILSIYLLLTWSKLGRILSRAFELVGIILVFISQIIFIIAHLLKGKVSQYIEREDKDNIFSLYILGEFTLQWMRNLKII